MDDDYYLSRSKSWWHCIYLSQYIPVQTDRSCIRNSHTIICHMRKYRNTVSFYCTSQHHNRPCHLVPANASFDRYAVTEEAEGDSNHHFWLRFLCYCGRCRTNRLSPASRFKLSCRHSKQQQ